MKLPVMDLEHVQIQEGSDSTWHVLVSVRGIENYEVAQEGLCNLLAALSWVRDQGWTDGIDVGWSSALGGGDANIPPWRAF